MKEKTKKVIQNSIIVFIICFLILFLYMGYENYMYYRVYSKEDLEQFFSLSDTLLFNLQSALYLNVKQMIVFVPILAIFEKTKMKDITKIIITLVITFIISFIYLLLNLEIVF